MSGETDIGENATKSCAIAILGMHRSGTSMLAGSLRNAGVYFGGVLEKPSARNPKGLHEAPAILFMQEDLLLKNGGSWHQPPESVVWQPMHKAVRDLFIESRKEKTFWAFKDPRTLLTLEGWFEVLPDLKCIGIFRHPAEVAASLESRNRFEFEKCLTIWRAYSLKLIEHTKSAEIPIIEFVRDPSAMQASVQTVLERFGLPAQQASE
ncbi:MAG: sulfotransferase, partial [Cyanobacteria bacterium P01_F01_bin.3]